MRPVQYQVAKTSLFHGVSTLRAYTSLWRAATQEHGMGKLELLENQIQSLSPEELARVRQWFLEYDWSAWERQIESDASAGKLDGLAERALQQHADGKSTPL